MPAMTVGFSEIEERLRLLRRRLNSLTLQHVLYVTGSVAVLAATLLIVLALRTRPSVFSVAFWTILGAVGSSLGVAGRQLRRQWVSVERACRWADQQAHLDDRLATLLAHRQHPRRSRLTGVLISQALALRHRWQPQTLAPHRVPRSVCLFGGSLMALLATAFLEREPAAPVPYVVTPPGHGGRPGSEQPGRAALLIPSNEPGRTHRWLSMAVNDQEREDGGDVPGDGRAPESHPGARAARAGGVAPGADGDSASRGRVPAQLDSSAARQDNSATARVQNLIRTAFGARPTGTSETKGPPRSDSGSPASHHPEPGHDLNAGARRPHDVGLNSTPSSSGRSSHGARGDGRTQPGANAPARGTGGGSGQAAGRGGTGAAGPRGLLAEHPELGGAARTASRTFPLHLSSLARAWRSTVEPQRPAHDLVPGATMAPRGEPEARLGEQDREDDPVLRGPIVPEYEPIVRRLFSHE